MSIPSPAIKLDEPSECKRDSGQPLRDKVYSREATETHIAFTQECLNGFRNLRSATSNSAKPTTDIKPTILMIPPLRPVRLPIYRSNADSEDAGIIAGVHGFGEF